MITAVFKVGMRDWLFGHFKITGGRIISLNASIGAEEY
jgi:hypothetical protein